MRNVHGNGCPQRLLQCTSRDRDRDPLTLLSDLSAHSTHYRTLTTPIMDGSVVYTQRGRAIVTRTRIEVGYTSRRVSDSDAAAGRQICFGLSREMPFACVC